MINLSCFKQLSQQICHLLSSSIQVEYTHDDDDDDDVHLNPSGFSLARSLPRIDTASLALRLCIVIDLDQGCLARLSYCIKAQHMATNLIVIKFAAEREPPIQSTFICNDLYFPRVKSLQSTQVIGLPGEQIGLMQDIVGYTANRYNQGAL